MPDNVSLFSTHSVLDGFDSNISYFSRYGLIFYPLYDKGSRQFRYFHAKDYNLEIRIYFNGKLHITGSLSKYYHNIFNELNTNHLDFEYDNLQKVIEIIESKYEIDSNHLKISKIENGINLIMSLNPNDYMNLICQYKSKYSFENMKSGHFNYGKKVFTSYKSVKIYNKSFETKRTLGVDIKEHILRFEVEYKKACPIFKRIRYLSDLKCFENYTFFKNELMLEFQKLEFIETNLDASFLSPNDVLLYHASKSKTFLQEYLLSGIKGIHNTRKKIRELEKRVIEHPFSEASLTKELTDKLKTKIEKLTTCNIQ